MLSSNVTTRSFVETDFIDNVSIQNWNANNSNDTNSKFNDFLWRVEMLLSKD